MGLLEGIDEAAGIALPIGPLAGLAEVQNPEASAVKREARKIGGDDARALDQDRRVSGRARSKVAAIY